MGETKEDGDRRKGSGNLVIKIFENMITPTVGYGVEIWEGCMRRGDID